MTHARKLSTQCHRSIESLPDLSKILLDEIDFTGMYASFDLVLSHSDDWCHKNPKNYQVWFHRRWLVEQIYRRLLMDTEELYAKETSRISELIESEPKHLNAWSHRLFLANLFKVFESNAELELAFAEKFIEKDVRNNTAWSYRRHCLDRAGSTDWGREITFVLGHIMKAPSNESPWVYLRSIRNWFENEEVKSACIRIYETFTNVDSGSCLHRHVADTLAILYEKTGRMSQAAAIRERLATVDLNRQPILRYTNTQVHAKLLA